ncbi:MAG TPA: NAD(P)-binding domain-containing protein [Gemmatimonadaceae bacterium]|nr:NAD(P)-binding domain-containing protein [Gemmatimonadaceae bacterium]
MTLTAPFRPRESHGRTERFETIVIGAGQAGLAVGHHLAAHDLDFVLLTEDARIGDNWRRRWDSLRLFTPARYSALPGMPFPAPATHLPDKDEVAAYLERYAERFDLPIRPGTRVDTLERSGERWVVRANGRVMEATDVVVATGAFQRPRVPPLAARLSSGIHQVHSSAYRNPWSLPDGPVLVVGAGNSGAQIALELARFRKVWLAGRDTGHLPRRMLGRDLFDWIWPLMARITIDSRLGRRMHERTRRGDALVGIPERTLREAGIRRVGRVDEERGGLPVADQTVLEPAAIVWCTGFEPDFGWIGASTGSTGVPDHHRGVATTVPGLHFAGLRFQHTLTSSLIGGVGADAAYIASVIAARADARPRD